MTPVQQYANLRALAYGLQQAINDYKAQVVAFREMTDAQSFKTSWGPVTFQGTEPSIVLPQGPLLEWARQNMPHEVVEETTVTVTQPAAVRPSLLATLKGEAKKPGRFRIVGDDVVDHDTGEVIGWAVIAPADPTPVFSPPRERKEAAAELVADRLAQLAAVAVPEVES